MKKECKSDTNNEHFRVKLVNKLGIMILLIFASLLLVSIAGYVYKLEWTGLIETQVVTKTKTISNQSVGPKVEEVTVEETSAPKTLWDWLNLLIIPGVIAAAAFWFKRIEEEIRQERYKKEAEALEYSEKQRAQESVLDAYFIQMSDLLLDKDTPLLSTKAGSPIREMAFVHTVTALRRLDNPERRNLVIGFLRDMQLLGRERERIRITGVKF